MIQLQQKRYRGLPGLFVSDYVDSMKAPWVAWLKMTGSSTVTDRRYTHGTTDRCMAAHQTTVQTDASDSSYVTCSA